MATLISIMPGWLIAILLFTLLVLASEVGSRLRRRLNTSGETIYAASAAVSLLVLLIGFTFSLSLNRYDTRRDLAVEEAAAIYSLWQRLPLIAAPAGPKLAQLTRGYAEQRLDYFTRGIDHDQALRADRAGDIIVERMWNLVRGLTEKETTPLIARMLMDNLTRIDDAAWRRETMAREHIPYFVLDLLVIFALMTATSLGVVGPPGRRVHVTHVIFFGLTAAAIVLLVDLDRPRTGLVLVSQRPLVEVLAVMTADDARISPGLRDAATTPLVGAKLPANPTRP
jgi:hypothetical protein